MFLTSLVFPAGQKWCWIVQLSRGWTLRQVIRFTGSGFSWATLARISWHKSIPRQMLHKFQIFILSNHLFICVHIKAIFLSKGEAIDCAGGNVMFIRDVFQKMTWVYNLEPVAWIWETHFWGVLDLFLHRTNWILVFCSAEMESRRTHFEDGMPCWSIHIINQSGTLTRGN